VRARKIFRAKAARIKKRDRQCIAERERGRGAGSGGQIERARFPGNCSLEVYIGQRSKRRVGAAGDRDQAGTLPSGDWHDSGELFGGARVRHRNQHVVAGHHAKIAVTCLCRMQKKRRCPGGGQRCCDFPGNMAGLADAADNHSARAVQNHSTGLNKGRTDSLRQSLDCFGLNAKHFDRAQDQPVVAGYNGSGIHLAEYMLSGLELALILLGAATLIVVPLRRFGVPPLIAYLAVGVLIGPHAAGLAEGEGTLHAAAELGVVFLMFSLGLEFNFAKLNAMRGFVFGLGGAQVGVTALALMALLLGLPATWGSWLIPGLDWRTALVVAFALAMSSTALVTKLLVDRRELETDHGRRVFSVLLFQDLAVIPLLVVIPALSRGTDGLAIALSVAFAKAALLLVLLLRFGPRLMRGWFGAVVRSRSHELFTLNVLLATLLFAWLTRQAGLSMELGAFVAGMLIAETEFRYQVEEDIKPFRDVLLGLFFVTIGARLETQALVDTWQQVLVILSMLLVLKAAIVLGLVRAFGASAGVAIRSACWLAQTGEFAFVLLSQAFKGGLFEPAALQPLLAAILLSLLLAPALIEQANRLALRASNQEWLLRSLEVQRIASRSLGRHDHVIVCGFGRCGQSLSHVLEAENVPFLALDTDPDRVREAAEAGESVVYGDASRPAMLQAAGIHRARALAITFDDLPSALKLLHTVRQLAPQLPVIARTANEADIAKLREAGATEVVPEIAEGSLMIASHAMALAGVPMARVRRRTRAVRAGRYALLQGFFHGADDRETDDVETDHVHLHAVPIIEGSVAASSTLGAMLEDGVRATALVRARERMLEPPADFVLAAGDVVVLAGRRDRITAVETRMGQPAGG